MAKVTKILVPVDLDGTSTRVLEYGRLLADACGASMHLLHIIAYPLEGPEHEAQERSDACRRLEALLDQTDRDKRRATVASVVGTPLVEIVRYATDHAIDLIVMGTHAHDPTFQMVSGSTAENIIRTAPCPVLAVKNGPPAVSAR
jgi:nucleotide-binding universal stress UspA family protein